MSQQKFATEAKKEGLKNQIAGAIKGAAAKLTGNKTGQVEGQAQESFGEAQYKTGEAVDDRDEARREERQNA